MINEATYWAGVAWVERCKPTYVMLNRLKRGYTKINTIYLGRILAEIGEQPKNTAQEASSEDSAADRMNPEFLALSRLIGGLFGRRRKLSNTFHDCKPGEEGNNDRAMISDDIRNVQKQISRALKRKRHYELTGQMLKSTEVAEAKELDGVALSRAYQAAGKRKSYALRQVKRWAVSEDPRASRQLEKWEGKLKTETNEFDRLSKAYREAAV